MADHGNWDRGPSCERSPLPPRHKPVCVRVSVCGKRIAKDKSKNLDITDNYSLVDQDDHTLKEMDKEVGVGGRLLVLVQQAPE